MTTTTFHTTADLRAAGFATRIFALQLVDQALDMIDKAAPLQDNTDKVVQAEADAGSHLISELTDAVLEIVGRYDKSVGIDE